MQAKLIALDWGTSSLRAYKLGAGGEVLEQRSLPLGVMQLPQAPHPVNGQPGSDGFELAFEQACGDWLNSLHAVPVIACGMVGSAQGWREAPYCDTPTDASRLASTLQRVRSRRGIDVHIVPGVIQRSPLPNVMRGEETQVLGVLHAQPPQAQAGLLIGLPGSHSKWVQVVDGRIAHFDTFMTGEVFAVLSQHSILGRTQQPGSGLDGQAFDRGVQVALSADSEAGVLSTLFSARSLGLTGVLSGAAQVDYLSGLLIGHELAALAHVQRQRRGDAQLPPLVLVGNAELCSRYRRALGACGFTQVSLAEQATEQGLWQLAVAAGLITCTLPR
ncbi:2-dehydro-3-deoxygalactonokinase [Pseudomonas xanthosomatis]|uniref:2-dehydro-3-deoxygalactonokinase n=1 Tax=Pseudomonas xanthosomatis TaxID=2842356 RepID=UPI0035172936